LYRQRRWTGGQFQTTFAGGRSLPAEVSASTLFG